jgi:hypothetical protein
MSSQSVNGRSLELVDTNTVKTRDGSSVSPKPTFELIDSTELARRLSLPASWVRSHTRRRTLDEIPSVRFGKYVRFKWGSSELQRWIDGHAEAR